MAPSMVKGVQPKNAKTTAWLVRDRERQRGLHVSMHIEVPRHFWAQKSPLLRGEWPLQNPRVFTSKGRSLGPPCLDAFHLRSMGG